MTLCTVLERMNRLCKLLQCVEVHAFAIASLRNIQNNKEVLQAIPNLGITIRLLSGEEEAECDFLGLMATNCTSAGIGSGRRKQPNILFSKQKTFQLCFHTHWQPSHNRFVQGIIPTQSEMRAIKQFVRQQLETYPQLKKMGFEIAYAIGGTVRAAARLHRAFTGQDRPMKGYWLTLDDWEFYAVC